MLELAGRVYGRAQASEFRDARAERAKLIVAQPGEVARVGKVFLRQTQLLFHCHSLCHNNGLLVILAAAVKDANAAAALPGVYICAAPLCQRKCTSGQCRKRK